MGKIRGTHSSPGVYTQFTDLSYAANSLGITTLGLVGETKKGPAFEPIAIKNWTEFNDYFGGTSAEKFKDSQYPKYELPYIAKSYLSASEQLYVCRVLGLSGYNAGPAWAITANNNSTGKEYVVAIIRARGDYQKYATVGDICSSGYTTYDTLAFDCDTIELQNYTSVQVATQCNQSVVAQQDVNIGVTSTNLGQFTIVAKKNGGVVGRYPVSFNAATKDYIYNVLGSDPSTGSAAVYVEEFYDVMLQELADNNKVNQITSTARKINELRMTQIADAVSDFVSIPSGSLSRKNLGQTFLGTEDVSGNTDYVYYETDTNGKVVEASGTTMMGTGFIYQVASYLNSANTRTYVYVQMKDDNNNPLRVGQITTNTVTPDTVNVVKVLTYDRYFHLDANYNVVPSSDMSDYHEEFRCASTPWIVSELKGDGKNLQVKKLFRFHTISDGTSANSLVKISIANVRPDEGTFDVQIRDFNDSDNSPSILENYRGLSMVPGDSKYIGLKIGTVDGAYESKSKYVMVEVIENDMTQTCVPCGFLGYPVRDYSAVTSLSGSGLTAPSFTYNTEYDEDRKDKRQYFGLSDIKGVDVDMLYYKGKNAYTEDYRYGYTHPFHLDSTLNQSVLSNLSASGLTVTIDGDSDTAGITWDAVSPNYDSSFNGAPIIGSEEQMSGTLYEKVALRKFTVYPFGGFDGWDIYRKSRTNTDEFKASKYKGNISNGIVSTFTKVTNAEAMGLEAGSITSDYYAYLAGANQFEIPEKYVINLFATPGIDYVNNTMLTNEILDMIEEKRGDSLYVVTTPDKPFGASDARDEMYTSSDAASNLEDTSIDTYYATTYYPWVKYYDSDNSIYVNLPATKDALRNMANVDNKKFPWYAAAGIERGNVDCTKMHFFAKLEDEDNVYDGRINPLKTFSEDGVKIWGNKTMYTGDTPMNRVNVVRLMLYMRKLISQAALKLIFDPNDTTLKAQFEGIVNPILAQIKNDRGITAYRLQVSQTAEEMDAHELNCKLFVKPTPVLEYISIDFVVTPQGVDFDTIA